MHVTIATEPASDGQPGDDFVAALSHAVVVLDGAGATGAESGCRHGTQWYVRQLGGALAGRLCDDPAINLSVALAEAIRQVRDLHADGCDLGHPGTPSAAAALLREGRGRLDYALLGDAYLVFDTTDGVNVVSDRREATVAAGLGAPGGRLDGPDHDDERQRLADGLRSARNRAGGFWVAAADPTAVREAVTGSVDVDQLIAAAALTDGAARLVDPFALADWPKAMAILASHGSIDLLHQVRDAEMSDPYGERWPRLSATDDATIAHCTSFVRG